MVLQKKNNLNIMQHHFLGIQASFIITDLANLHYTLSENEKRRSRDGK